MKATAVKSLPKDKAYLLFSCILNGHDQQVDYDLVIPLGEADCRGTFDQKGIKRPKSHRIVWLDAENNRRIPMGRTMVRTKSENYPFNRFDDGIDLPFRDGAHASWDNERLGGLGLYYQTPSGIYKLTQAEATPTP